MDQEKSHRNQCNSIYDTIVNQSYDMARIGIKLLANLDSSQMVGLWKSVEACFIDD